MGAVKLNLLRFLFYFSVGVLRNLQKSLTPQLGCSIQNLFSKILKIDTRFKYNKDLGFFVANNKLSRRYFIEMERGFDLYQRGITHRGSKLFESYCLDLIDFNYQDIVIDCGANYGDLFLGLENKIRQENYITFEPGPNEFKCLSKSLPFAINNNLGLSNKKGKMNFYLLSEKGDSSVIKVENFREKIQISVTTLDEYTKENNIATCKLFKLEAEGWEPEILQGATNFIKKCEYVAIDGGPERGKDCKTTFPILNNQLINFDFEMIEIRGAQYRALYKNKELNKY